MDQIKKMTKEDVKEMRALAAYAFQWQETPEKCERFAVLAAHSWNYGSFDSMGKLASQVIAIPFAVNFHGVRYQMAGIGFVSSYPEYRGQGRISQLMAKILQDCRQKGIALSYLAPFSYPFYRRYGYEMVFERSLYTIRSEHFPQLTSETGAKRVDFAAFLQALLAVYPNIARNQKGGLIRERWWCSYQFERKQYRYAVYYNSCGHETGYLAYLLDGSTFVMKELNFTDQNAYKGLMSFIGSHSSAFAEFRYECGYDGRFLQHLVPNGQLHTAVRPEMMGRIVDLEIFLQNYPFSGRQRKSFVLQVTEDRYAEWNVGSYQLQFTNDTCTVTRQTDSHLPVIRGSIQAVTQLLLGVLPLKELLFFGKLTLSDETALADLNTQFPTERPILEDYF